MRLRTERTTESPSWDRQLVLLLLLLLLLLAAALGAGLGIDFGGSPKLPAPRIVSAPPGVTFSTHARLAFSDPKPVHAFMCSLDGATATYCGGGTSGSASYDGLAAGQHTFSVYALAGSRQSLPAQESWRIDVRSSGSGGHTSRLGGHTSRLGGSGKGTGDVTGNARALGQPPSPVPFAIAGNAVGLLYPGGSARPVDLVFTNRNAVAITITRVTVTVRGTSTAACSAGSFEVVQNLLTSPAPVVVPAGSTRSLETLGIPRSQWPELRMLRHGNQDGCKHATIDLSYSGSAHS